MVRRARPTDQAATALRAAIAARLRVLADAHPGSTFAEHADQIAHGRPLVVDTTTLHRALTDLGDRDTARAFRHSTDPGNLGRYVIDDHGLRPYGQASDPIA